MRRIQVLLSLFLASISIDSLAQTIKGKVSDFGSGETLIGVNIVDQNGKGTTTNIDGEYTLKLAEGENDITFTFIGYEKATRKVKLSTDEVKELNVGLSIESTTLDLVVVTGSQFEKKLSEEMVSIDVVKEYLIENSASPDLKAAVGKVPGITILDGQASIRGGGGYSYGVGSRVQLVIDDIPLLTGDLKDIQWSAIPMETVEQIEVVKGSSSVLYGSGAMNGVIHVRTGWAGEKPETKFRIYQGVYSNPGNELARWWDKSYAPFFTGGFFSHRQKVKNFDFVVGAHGSSDKTYLKKGHTQDFRINFKTRYKPETVPGLSFGLNGNIQYQQHGRFVLWANDSTGAYIPLDGTASEDKYMFTNVDPWIQYSGEKTGLHSLKMRYFRVERRNTDWEDPSASNVMYFDYRFQNAFKYNFDVTAGVQYQYIWSASSLYRDAGTIVTHNPSVFAQVEKKFIDRISILFGIRNEWNNVLTLAKETSLPIFRGGANFKVAKKTNIRASFGQSFRFASIGEKFLNTSLGPLKIYPNEDLGSEKGWSAELGLKQGFRVLGWNGYFDFALFWMEFRDMVEYKIDLYDNGDGTVSPGFKPFNISQARVAGVEFGLNGDGALGPIPVRIFLGYTFNYPADLESDTTQRNVEVYIQNFFQSISNSDSLTATASILKYRTTNVFKFDVEADFWKFTLGMAAEYNSYMDRIDGEFEVLLPGFSSYRELHTTGVWRWDIRTGFRIDKRSSVSLIVKNVLNEFYSLRPGVMEAPRSFTLQYKLNI